MNCFTDLPQLGLISVTGKDAKTFLQGQLTCDLNAITPIQSLLGAHCNLKGRMQALFRVMQWGEDHYVLSLPLSMVSIALSNLQKYALFSKVALKDASNEFVKLAVAGEIQSWLSSAPITHATL